MVENNDIKVTVVCITYNHEEFIAQALDSFLMQKTNFKYQIFVGEDCGPDRTADIVREYAEKYPDIVIPFLREKNMGAQRNLIDLCNHATSPYIAFCEGDDYWTDEYKLQRQYDYMEANPEVRVCFAKAEIKAPEDWFLYNYYKKDKQGRMIFPDCDPPYRKKEGLLKAADFINCFPAHTSTVFYRWDYNLEIPDWYYDGYIGDWSIFLMQLGDGTAALIPDVVSVYRRSDVGVFMSATKDEHFLKSKKDQVRLLSGMLDFYEEHYPEDYPKVMIENRIKRDIALFIQSAMKLDEWNEILNLIATYEKAGKLAFNTFISFYFDSQRMSAKYGWEGNKLVCRDRYFMTLLKPFVKCSLKLRNCCRKMKEKTKDTIVYLAKFAGYWGFALIPKNPRRWAFSGFYKKGYIDNSKYFFEYVADHEPDIEAVWFTKDHAVYEQLKGEGRQVYKMNTLKGAFAMARAGVAVTDHYVMSDYSSIYGYNYRTKVVQLWHGVGFKAMGDGKKILSTTVKGVKLSEDILSQGEDSLLVRLNKKIKFFFKAPVRELCERYFLFVCPGQERIDMIGEFWKIPESNYFMAGHPRNIKLYQESSCKDRKILYAPTFRWNSAKEQEAIKHCLDALPEIQKRMEEINGTFVIRLHPHTWRNYQAKILYQIANYDRIEYDLEKDIYQSLQDYSVVITDYSSIGLDFAMIDKPVVFHTFDYEWFCKFGTGFNLNFEESIPGPQTFTWEETMNAVRTYVDNPKKDSALREERCRYFFTPECNGVDNSARICTEIKKRLNI